jgi:phospholipid/cholesterol/gamma-HCH transport system permease protein
MQGQTRKLEVRREQDVLLFSFAGRWVQSDGMPRIEDVIPQDTQGIRSARFDGSGVTAWDMVLPIFALRLSAALRDLGIESDLSAMPAGVRKLLDAAAAVPERKGAKRREERIGPIEAVGTAALRGVDATLGTSTFVGEAVIALGRMMTGRARYRRIDLLLAIQECGARALPIVTLISVLVGLILAFVGSVQLRMFGAQIYIADLVALGMAMEMGALMTAVIMAGRTGASYAAQLGTMQVNEEIDAMRTMGLSPMEFLVLPRLVALFLMMPLLCIYSDFLGMLGGALVGVTMLDITPVQYFNETKNAVELQHFAQGLIKSSVFGVLIAFAGCLRGMTCGRSAQAVGEATTSAVVTSIVLIVVADAVITIIYNVTGF